MCIPLQMLIIENDNYYLTIGRDAASTIESIDVNEQMAEWIKDIESHTDEECRSIVSYNITNEEMLNFVYGNTKPREIKRRRILSDPVLMYRANIVNVNGTKTIPSVAEEGPYVSEELFHAAFSETEKCEVISGIKVSNSAQDNFNILNLNKELGQYVGYHAAVTDTVTSDSGHNSALSPTEDFAVTSSELPMDSDSVFTCSLSHGNCKDHNMSFHNDSACKSVPQFQLDQSYHSGDDCASQDSSPTEDVYTTPTTGMYQSLNIAGGYDDDTL